MLYTKIGVNKEKIERSKRSMEAKIFGYRANEAEWFNCIVAGYFNTRKRVEIFCDSEPKITNIVSGGFNWNNINRIRESD